LSDDGYLYNPDSKLGQIHNPDVVPFESIADIPCLGLLGEPGIGKTQTMQAERKSIGTKIEKEGDQPLWLDLRYNAVAFYRAYPILQTVSAELSWSHYVELMALKNSEERGFYEIQAIRSGWSVSTTTRFST